jgi:ATP phosphoribosyltransferase regulatory subunit HisZ
MGNSTTTLKYPSGVRPLRGLEAAQRRRAEQRIAERLERAAFEEIILPSLDFVRPYDGVASEALLRRSYRFVDRAGDLVWLRSDFTPLAARMLAPRIDPDALPLRIFYRGDVIRCGGTRLGDSGALFQIGAEKIGGNDVADDIEIVSLVAAIFASLSIPIVIGLNDVRILPALLADVPRPERDRIWIAVQRKQARALEQYRALFSDLPFRLVEQLTRGELTLDALRFFTPTRPLAERLEAIVAALSSFDGVRPVLSFDDVEPEDGYYSGLRFEVSAAGGLAQLGRGGRYDGMYGKFGADVPAAGFTLTLDAIERLR